MRIFTATGVVLALLFPATPVHAENPGFYFSGHAGINLLKDPDQTFDVSDGTISLETDLGFKGGVALGYDFSPIRLEAEIAYRANGLSELSGSDIFGTTPIDGDLSALNFMVNGYYDFPLDHFPLTPYLGAGVGVASLFMDWQTPSANFVDPFLGPVTNLKSSIDDSVTVLAYQFAAGMGYDINPSMTLTVGYRFFATTDPKFDVMTTADSGSGPLTFTDVMSSEIQTHEWNLGVRVRF